MDSRDYSCGCTVEFGSFWPCMYHHMEELMKQWEEDEVTYAAEELKRQANVEQMMLELELVS